MTTFDPVGRPLRFTEDAATEWLERQYSRTTAYQWVRELAKNAFEADATRVHFGIEWEGVRLHDVYRRMIADDGFGMTPEVLVKHMARVIETGPKADPDGENHGIGGRMSLLPWNPEGIVVISTVAGGEPHMVQLRFAKGNYHLRRFGPGREVRKAGKDPEYGIDWRKAIPGWARDHGTVVVLLGAGPNDDTVRGNPEHGEAPTLRHPLTDRFYDLGDGRMSTEDLPRNRKDWPRTPIHRDPTQQSGSGAARKLWQARQNVATMRQVIERRELVGQGTVVVDELGTKVHWALAEKEHDKARIALLYKGELHESTSDGRSYRSWGIDQPEVYKRLWLIVEPPVRSGPRSPGVQQDEGRSHLTWSDGRGGGERPDADWHANWYEQMATAAPEISEALRALNEEEEQERSYDDPRYLEILQGMLKRMRARIPVLRVVDAEDTTTPTTTTTSDQDVQRKHQRRGKPNPNPKPPQPGPGEEVGTQRAGSREGGEEDAYESLARLGLPQAKWVDYELGGWLAEWQPGPKTVYLTRTHPTYREHCRFHRSERGVEQGPKVDAAVEKVMGYQARLKVAHAISLGKDMTREDVDAMLSSAALTVGLLGMEAIDVLIRKALHGKRKLKAA